MNSSQPRRYLEPKPHASRFNLWQRILRRREHRRWAKSLKIVAW